MKYIQPVLSNLANSCLTSQDIEFAKTTIISLDLRNLLIRPGKSVLLDDLKLAKYLAWNHDLVLNCVNLSIDKQQKISFTSEIDGTKFSLDLAELIGLLEKLDVKFTLLPKIETSVNLKQANLFISADLEEHQVFTGVYQVVDDNLTAILNFIETYPDSIKYLIGDLSLATMFKLRDYSDLYIENDKVSLDGYNGIVYRELQECSILDPSFELEYSVLDSKCQCYSCANGYTVAYLHHLFKNTPLLCQRLLISHNVFYINHLPEL